MTAWETFILDALKIAVAVMFAASLLFTLIWLPRIIRAVHDQYDADEQACAHASGDAEWLAILRASEHPIHDELMAQRLRAELDEWGKR